MIRSTKLLIAAAFVDAPGTNVVLEYIEPHSLPTQIVPGDVGYHADDPASVTSPGIRDDEAPELDAVAVRVQNEDGEPYQVAASINGLVQHVGATKLVVVAFERVRHDESAAMGRFDGGNVLNLGRDRIAKREHRLVQSAE